MDLKKSKGLISSVFFLVVFFATTKNVVSQTGFSPKAQIDSVEIAYQISNWEKVIEKGNNFLSGFTNKEFKTEDSLLIIESMKVSYRIAVANAFLNKMERARKFAKIDAVKDSLFKKQAFYKQYYQYAATGCIFLVDNKLDSSNTNLSFARDIAFNQLGTNRDIYLDASKNLVAFYIEKSEYNNAKLELQRILNHQKQEKDSVLLAKIYYSMFLVYYSDKDYLSALHCSETSLAFLQNNNQPINVPLLAKVYQAVGISYYQLKQYHLAKKYLHLAIDIHAIYPHQKNPDIALTYNYLGRVYRMLLNTELAIEYKTKANKIFEELNKTNGSFWFLIDDPFLIKSFEPKLKSKDKNPDASFYELLIDYDYIFTHLPLRYLKSSTQIRGSKDNSKVYQFAKQKSYNKLIPLFKNLLKSKMRQSNFEQMNIVLGYKIMGDMFLSVNQLDSATNYYQKALNKQLVRPLRINEIQNINLSNYKQTTQLIETLTSLANCFNKIAENSQTGKDRAYKQALDYYLMSDSLAENLSHYFKNERDKLVLTKQKQTIYNSTIEVLFNLAQQSNNADSTDAYLKSAFNFSQKNKTNQLQELIIKSDATKFKESQNSTIEKELELRKKIAFLKRQKNDSISDFNLLYSFEETKNKNITNNDTSLLKKYSIKRRSLAEKLDKAFQNYYEFKFDNSKLSIDEIQANLEPGSVLIDYHVNGPSLEIFVINKANFQTKRLTCDELTSDLLMNYIYKISSYYRKDDFLQHDYSDFKKYSKKLYDFLIKPVEQNLQGHHKLIFIVNKELSLLPFETLLVDTLNQNTQDLKKLNFLIKKFDIVYNYSCKLWLESKQKLKIYRKKPTNILAAAPVFEKEQMFASSAPVEKDENITLEFFEKLSPLRGTKKAVEEICQVTKTKGIKTLKRIYHDANKPQFKTEVVGKKHVLLATHGKSDDENPQFSGLYFSPISPQANDIDQAFLYSNEAYYLNLSSSLVVLYACKTGTGKINNKYGPMSVSRGFMASGAANVVHTLWSVNDLSTRDIVVEMYKHIFNNEGYSASLRKSKLELIELGIIPYHWAGLVLIGN